MPRITMLDDESALVIYGNWTSGWEVGMRAVRSVMTYLCFCTYIYTPIRECEESFIVAFLLSFLFFYPLKNSRGCSHRSIYIMYLTREQYTRSLEDPFYLS